jgi:hypothetical protein
VRRGLSVGPATGGCAEPRHPMNAALQLRAPDPPVWTKVSSTSNRTTAGLGTPVTSGLPSRPDHRSPCARLRGPCQRRYRDQWQRNGSSTTDPRTLRDEAGGSGRPQLGSTAATQRRCRGATCRHRRDVDVRLSTIPAITSSPRCWLAGSSTTHRRLRFHRAGAARLILVG